MLTYITIGVVLGATYGLLATGLIFVYQTTRVLNFAFGAFGMVGCYAFASLQSLINPWLAFLACVLGAVVVGAGIGAVTTRVQRIDPVSKAVATLALLTGLEGIVLLFWGANPRATPALAPALAFRFAYVGVTWQRIIVVIVDVLATVGMVIFFRRGRVGAALRAVADEPNIAQLIGLPVRALWIAAWAASTTVAVIVMILLLPDLGLNEDSLALVVLVPITAVVVAEFRSVPIGFGVAFFLGVAQSIFAGYVQLSPYEQVLPLAVIMLALAIRRTTPTYERV